MNPNENEATAAVDAAARKHWELHTAAYDDLPPGNLPPGAEPPPPWDELDMLTRQQVKMHVLPTVWAALEALGEEWGRMIANDSMGNGHMAGHVSSTWKRREEAEESLLEDQVLVRRTVGEWRPAGG